ncbi:MAG: S41 family peptidase [Bacillus sp. (in: firmicutes)]
MEDQDKVEKQDQEKKSGKYVKIKMFPFIMGIFLIVFLTAGITSVALLVGDEKVQPTIINEREEFTKLYEAYDSLKEQYYENIKDEDLVNGAIDGMLESLDDPYSDYMDNQETDAFNERISSSFEGIGAEIQQQDKQIIIVSPIKGSPAEEAGLKANDVIVSVDGKALEGMSSSEAVALIRGEKGTKVTLEIQRGDADPFKVDLTRDTIPMETVYPEMLENNIAKIHVTSFSEHTTDELMDAIEKMEAEGMKAMILDLRGNPGGIMNEAIKIASLFVPEGEILFQVDDREGNTEVIKSENASPLDIPVAILIDNGSASASEIVAAAVQETTDIPVIGTTSFGKGTVQTAISLDDGSTLKYTTAKWLTPEGNWINEKGVKPDVTVELPDYANLTYISPDAEMKEGTSSEEVEVAEKMLDALGYKVDNIDDQFDQSTKEAVQTLQEDHDLEPTGILTGDTTLELMTLLREKILENDTQVAKATEVIMEQLKK